MSTRLACSLVLVLAAGHAAAQPPAADPQPLHVLLQASRPPGIDVLNLATVDGELRLLGTSETLGAIRTLQRRMQASPLLEGPSIDAVYSPKEGPHVFALSARDRRVPEAVAAMPGSDPVAAITAAAPADATLSATESGGRITVDGHAPSQAVVAQVMRSLDDLAARGTIEAPTLASVTTGADGRLAFRITTQGAASPRRMGGE